MFSQKDKESKIVKDYLTNKKILIADPSAAARSGMFRVFKEMGVATSQVTLVNSYKQALEQIELIKPAIVVAEYDLDRKCGLDLFQRLRQENPKYTKESLFIIVTSNTSQSAVAKAAEEDIDGYVLKPFTIEVVRKTFLRSISLKVCPPQYVVLIEEGKTLLADAKIDEAEAKFKEAYGLDPNPALACYYIGQVKFLKKIIAESKGAYSKGLEFNKIHYKCLVGLYELLMKQNQHGDAYEIVKRISQYFPANPKRLGEVLRLAIVNAKYEDVEKYYAVFCNIDERDESLIKYICAALVVCGKYYLNTGHKIRALELFQKAAATGTGRSKILREVIQALLDHQMVKETKEFLPRFPKDKAGVEDYLLANFQILDAEGSRSMIIEQAKDLIGKGISDEKLFESFLTRLAESGLTGSIDSILQQAVTKFPQKKAIFEKAIVTGANKRKAVA